VRCGTSQMLSWAMGWSTDTTYQGSENLGEMWDEPDVELSHGTITRYNIGIREFRWEVGRARCWAEPWDDHQIQHRDQRIQVRCGTGQDVELSHGAITKYNIEREFSWDTRQAIDVELSNRTINRYNIWTRKFR
jgi:hypothetical protein